MSVDACADLVARKDPDRFLSAMTAPTNKRAALLVLYAFNLEVARAPWTSTEPLIAAMRLQFWADTLEAIGEGRAVPGHEVAVPLADLIAGRSLPLGPLQALVAARQFDIGREAHADRAAFDAYQDATSGGLMWLAALALGAPMEAECAVRDHGWGAGLAALLRAYPALHASGRRPLLDDAPEAIAALASDGLVRIRAARGAKVGNCAAALRAGWQARAILRQAAADPGSVIEGRLGLSEAKRRGLLLWKSAIGGW
ncbi:MAG: squalene/phytoene synthase family protein [Rhodobacteraceae bacterium]|nr:squalene/phytoene synthase family protein [Paracoccaceae bacterium]